MGTAQANLARDAGSQPNIRVRLDALDKALNDLAEATTVIANSLVPVMLPQSEGALGKAERDPNPSGGRTLEPVPPEKSEIAQRVDHAEREVRAVVQRLHVLVNRIEV